MTLHRIAAGAIVALTFAAAACAPGAVAPPAVVTASVPIATPVYCEIPLLTHPQLPIAALAGASPPADTVRAYAASVALLKSAVVERDAILEGCAAPAASSSPAAPAASAPAPAEN